jgi:hypothetical protein
MDIFEKTVLQKYGVLGMKWGERHANVSQNIKDKFENNTLPLRKKLKFDDQVVYLDEKGNIKEGQVTFSEGARDTVTIEHSDKTIITLPMSEVRMPKGGYRTRGE